MLFQAFDNQPEMYSINTSPWQLNTLLGRLCQQPHACASVICYQQLKFPVSFESMLILAYVHVVLSLQELPVLQ